MKRQNIPTASKFTVLRQLCNHIPPHLVPKLARETGVDDKARTFDEWSHIVSLCYAQVTHSIGLNDVCDALQLKRVRAGGMGDAQGEAGGGVPGEGGKVVSDELVGLKNPTSQKAYPELMRRIVAWVEVDGQERLMTFLTNQLTWSPESVVESVPLPLADRSLLQADQRDPAVGGFPGHQRQCGTVAGLDGTLSLFVAALPGLSSRSGLTASAGCLPSCARVYGANGTYSSS